MKIYKNIYVAFFLFVLGLTQVNAQQIIKAEYYFSADPGIGNGIDIPITPGDSVNVTFTADLSTLEAGNYSVFVRLMDDNHIWTQTMYRYLVIAPTLNIEPIANAEYFFNNDPGVGNGFPINFTPGDSVDITSTISLENLEPGNHTLCVRARDLNLELKACIRFLLPDHCRKNIPWL